MKLQKILCLVPVVLAMNLLSFVVAQTPEKPFYLHDGDTVVFYGDSITEQRFYTYWVQVYTATRFPGMHVEFFSEGVGGDRVDGGGAGPIDTRLERDVFPHQPSVVTIMLGMNDGGYRPLTPEIEAKYKQGYEHILASLQHTLPAARITLLGPSPYDEVTRPEMFPGGYNSTLVHFAEIDADLARKQGATFIDLNQPFVQALKVGVSIDPLATELLLPDRVHPEQLAHWFMATAMLKGWNAPSIVSATTIDAEKLVAHDLTRSHISDLHGEDATITWTELDDALPLPLDDSHAGNHFMRKLINLDEAIDQQPLKIERLKPGNYELTIDSHAVGRFTHQDFADGVNLALLNTPMRGQAYTVGWAIRDRDDTHYVRMKMLVNQMKSGESREKGAAELALFEKVQQKTIYELAQPHSHTFQIKAISDTEPK